MDAKRLLRLQGDLTRYLDDVLPDLGRQNRRHWAELYLRGLLLDGRGGSVGEKRGSEMTLPKVLAEMQCLLWCWAGYCPICDRPLENDRPVAGDGPTTDTG